MPPFPMQGPNTPGYGIDHLLIVQAELYRFFPLWKVRSLFVRAEYTHWNILRGESHVSDKYSLKVYFLVSIVFLLHDQTNP
jgi:hypothetical protein